MTMGRHPVFEGEVHHIPQNNGTVEFVTDEELETVDEWMKNHPGLIDQNAMIRSSMLDAKVMPSDFDNE